MHCEEGVYKRIPLTSEDDPARWSYLGINTGMSGCVRFLQKFGLPLTSEWREGPPVLGNDIPAGTAIATFNARGRYSSHHAAFFIRHVPGGIRVLDQINGKPSAFRTIQNRGGRGAPANDAAYYSVIDLPPYGAGGTEMLTRRPAPIQPTSAPRTKLASAAPLPAQEDVRMEIPDPGGTRRGNVLWKLRQLRITLGDFQRRMGRGRPGVVDHETYVALMNARTI